ncbi:MAG: acetyltransferase [Spartobacteria bacterium]|nr:acetyltransferase [Spartobacteria bacterium]
MTAEKCVILGGGGHAKVLISCLLETNPDIELAILDSNSSLRQVCSVSIIGDDSMLPELVERGFCEFVVGVGSTGNCSIRVGLYEKALACGLLPRSVIHPTAIISPQASFGRGCQLMPGCIINADARIGENTIINTGAIVEHDCLIGSHVHLATGARLAGGVRVGDEVHIGIGSTVRQKIKIHTQAVVGAGAVVIGDVAACTVVAGVPAKPIG